MGKALPLSGSELGLLAALVQHKVRFMVVGLSAAALQGAPVVTEDIDLWFEDLGDPKMTRALRSVGAAYVPPMGLNPPMLAGYGSEPFDVVLRMDGLGTFADEMKNAERIHLGSVRLHVLPLERILTSKLAANRAKDRPVIPALKNALRALSMKRPRKSKPSTRQPNPKRPRRKTVL